MGASYSARTKELFQKYGKVAVGVHLSVYAVGLAGCYVAVERGVKVQELLARVGLLSGNENPTDPENQGWLEKFVTGGGSSLTLAFLCNKALFPVRAPVTIGLTPMVARLLRRHAAVAAKEAEAAAESAAARSPKDS